MVKKITIIFTLLTNSLFLYGCSSQQLTMNYQGYGKVADKYPTASYLSDNYGVFLHYNAAELPILASKPFSMPSLACKLTYKAQNQLQTKYIRQVIESRPLDNQYTYFVSLDFSFLINKHYLGYVEENENTYLVNDPTCRIIYTGDYETATSPIMTIPKQDITRPKQTSVSEQK